MSLLIGFMSMKSPKRHSKNVYQLFFQNISYLYGSHAMGPCCLLSVLKTLIHNVPGVLKVEAATLQS
jgi:hypothetical protein